jgi:uncharacterized protein (TIGR00299 family) protein
VAGRLVYLDCISGAAGDMLLGALLDAGADEDYVRRGLAALGVEGLELEVAGEECHGIGATRIRVTGGGGPSRRWPDIRGLIDGAGLPRRARDRAQAVFQALAEAEAAVHRTEPELVHFHEVGAVDAIADVCGIALALEALAVDELTCSPLPVPRGFASGSHGRLPLPAPATLELLEGAPLYGVDLDVELVTPTGAAVVGALATRYGELPPLRLESVGYGAGARDLPERPNLLRVVIGEALAEAPAPEGRVALIETNLDDLSPELVPDAAARCTAAGALDVWVTPVQMKKGRPGVVLSALARPADERSVTEALLRETSTLGVRISELRRVELERAWRTVEVAGQPVRVKLGSLGKETLSVAPEHDDCAQVAARTGRPVRSVWAAALAAAGDGQAGAVRGSPGCEEPPP